MVQVRVGLVCGDIAQNFDELCGERTRRVLVEGRYFFADGVLKGGWRGGGVGGGRQRLARVRLRRNNGRSREMGMKRRKVDHRRRRLEIVRVHGHRFIYVDDVGVVVVVVGVHGEGLCHREVPMSQFCRRRSSVRKAFFRVELGIVVKLVVNWLVDLVVWSEISFGRQRTT